MKYSLFATAIVLNFVFFDLSLAWDGFDADSAELVEVIPDQLPNVGDKVEVRNYDANTISECYVESILRNQRTIELVVRDMDGKMKTLVMEGK